MTSTLSSSFDSREPNIRKAKFILPNERVYTLEFDYNIQMQELKLMIQKAAHLRKNNFKLLSKGEDYTPYNEEIFDNIFPHQSLVVFTLEPGEGEEIFDETELLLQMNSPCPVHIEKFLLYYCFTCNTSICSECFINGIHKNHKIQDKCFYLLPSKYLVEKMFENWSSRPYDDYQISVDLAQFKAKVNSVMFDELFKMLKKIQEKCNLLIDEYNTINQNSLGNIRDSVRDIKVSCIKALDNLKEELNIKDIVNNEEIFVEFDSAYKELGKLQNAKFQKNLLIFQELNKKVSTLVSNLINQIHSSIYKSLNDCLNEQEYNNIKYQISQKLILPADKNEIINQLSEHKKKRKSYININNIPKPSLSSILQDKINSDKGKDMNSIKNNIHVNDFLNNESNAFQIQNKSIINSNSNLNKVNFGYINNSIGQTKIMNPPLNPNAKFGINSDNITSNNTESNITFNVPGKVVSSVSSNIINNLNSNLNSKYGAQIKNDEDGSGPYSSAQITRQIITTNLIPKIKTDTIFSASNNRENITFNNISSNISSTSSNLTTNINNKNNINNQFGVNLNNINKINNINGNSTTTQITNINNPQQIYKTIETKAITTTTKAVIPNTVLSNIIVGNNTNHLNINTDINHNNPQFHNNTIITYTTNSVLNPNEKYINLQRNTILEETESETEIRRPTDVRRFLKTDYILCPVPQTNSIKIITQNNKDERTVPLKFPENFGFNSFLIDCAHCNCSKNKCLYVSGGIESNSQQKRSNSLLCIDITKPDEYKVIKKASMNFARCGHTMISDNKYIYVVGGEDLNSVERYDIENDIWEILPNMIKPRMYPILYIHNGYLYAFFGKYKNGDYPCSIERLNISGSSGISKPSWEMVIFSNPKNIDLRYYGCALHEIKGLLYFFGGKCNEKSSDKIFFYSFENRFIEQDDSPLLWKEYFRENIFHRLGERLVQCSETKYFGVYLRLQEE